MTFHRIACVFTLLGLAACSKQEAAPRDQPGVSPGGRTVGPITELETKYNIGDVEFTVKPIMQLATESQLGKVDYKEQETKRGDLAMAEATVGPPYPSSLFVISRVSTPSGFRETDTVVIKQRVFIDGRNEPVKEALYVWTGRNGAHTPGEIKLDLVPLLESLSGSVLLYTRVEIIWFPDRAPATVDINAAPDSPQHVVEKLSNTLRITFE